MAKRISRSLSDVAKELLQILKNDHGVTDEQLNRLRQRVINSGHRHPLGGIKVRSDIIWIDYEVQRDIIIKTILALLKDWDNRICQPAATYTTTDMVELIDEVNHAYKFKRLFVHDAQHRCVTMLILGFEEIYVTVVVTDEPRFPSYAFRTSNSVVKKIGKPDFHRNNIRLYSLGVYDDETVPAFNLQTQFDRLGIDFVEKPEKIPAAERKDHYMSHFDYAYKPMGADKSGKTAGRILDAIIKTWPKQEKIQNGVYIGLHHMNERVKSLGIDLPDNWMSQVCKNLVKSYSTPAALEAAAERQAKHIAKSKTWNVPESMYKFMREVYRLNGGKLTIPGDGADLELEKGFWFDPNLIPNHKHLYQEQKDVA